MRRDALRRYPALGFLAVAAALALLLPSRLSAPRSDPATLAEFAPVPGAGEGTSDLSQVGEAGPGGVDATTSRTGTGPGSRDTPGSLAGRPKPGDVKRCVGTPPRQTEDPLSPPCVPAFDGDNGGATARGVTRDEIRMVVRVPDATSSKTTPGILDLDDPNASDPDAKNQTIVEVTRAFASYFNARYQLYGRRAHFFVYQGANPGVDEIRAEVADMVDRIEPFAVVPLDTQCRIAAREIASRKVITVCYQAFDRAEQQRIAPFLQSYAPDLQDEARIAGGYVCRKLRGRPAIYHGDQTEWGRERLFGILFQRSADNPEYEILAGLLQRELEACGIEEVHTASAGSNTQDQHEYALNVAALRNAGVTTVILLGSSSAVLYWTNDASGSGWNPEWIVPGTFLATGSDTNFVARSYNPVAWRNAFGISYDYRRGATREQQWYAAYHEGCGGCADQAPWPEHARLYDVLVEQFWGIQGAGPRLTPANVDKGLHAIPERTVVSPTSPVAYFAPGNYSWIKDAMPISWDPGATEPGGSRPGCYRLPGGGIRFRGDTWTAGDGDARSSDAPCQGPDR